MSEPLAAGQDPRPIHNDFKPGDVIIRKYLGGTQYSYTVQDPPRTARGKLRVKGEKSSTVSTTWWTPDSVRRPLNDYMVIRA